MGLAVIPSDWTDEYIELCVKWPNSPEWLAILRGQLNSPNDTDFWDPFTGDPEDPKIAIEETIDQNLHLEECMIIPVGAMLPYAGVWEPTDYLFCHGQEISRAAYPVLFDTIGIRFGAGDGTTTFNIPDRRGRVAIGWSDTDIDFNDVGNTGGEKSHTLTIAELASHTHVQNAHTHVQNAHTHVQNAHTHVQNAHDHVVPGALTAGDGTTKRQLSLAGGNNVNSEVATATNQNATPTNQNATPTNQNATATNQNTGNGDAHNNLPPYLVHEFIIKAR